jgi:Flp pilus assembly protein TadG
MIRLRYKSGKKKISKFRQGQAMVEMAIVLMLLLILTLGIADAGFFMFRYVEAANCTREYARRAAVHDSPADALCVGTLAPTLTYSGDYVTATIETDHDWLFIGQVVPGMGSSITLRSVTSMRMEPTQI